MVDISNCSRVSTGGGSCRDVGDTSVDLVLIMVLALVVRKTTGCNRELSLVVDEVTVTLESLGRLW
jgi:hypothetical protein